jgi:CRISPR system Cascade subunit CasC
MKNFINFHVLISHSPSCLNRDDMNMQKSAVFGGVRRVRISSQSLKRAIRNSDYYREHLGEASTRTRSLEKLKIKFSEELKNEFPVEIVHECVDRFVRAKASEEIEGEESEVEAANSSGKKENRIAVAPWVLNEIRELCAILGEIKKQGLNDEELAKVREKFSKQKSKKKKTEQELVDEVLDKKIKNEMEEKKKSLQLALASAIDIALSGHMTTSGLMTSVDGALAMAHAIYPRIFQWSFLPLCQLKYSSAAGKSWRCSPGKSTGDRQTSDLLASHGGAIRQATELRCP